MESTSTEDHLNISQAEQGSSNENPASQKHPKRKYIILTQNAYSKYLKWPEK